MGGYLGNDERYDVRQIEGNENMSQEEKEYFSKSWTTMGDQEEIIADKYDLDSETMRDEFADIMNDLVNNKGEYIVNGALLKCSMQMDVDSVQKLSYKGTDIISRAQITEEMFMLKLPENRAEDAGGNVFANVEDTVGGMRDEVGEEGHQLNIVSFGNCKRLEEEDIMSIAEFMCNDWHLADNKAWRTFSKDEIAEKIKEAIKQGKGTCYCGMLLNPEWENLPTKYDFATDSFQMGAVGEYTGYKDKNFGIVPEDGVARDAALAVLRGEADNPIGDIQYHFGKVDGFDIWCEADKCSSVIVIGEGAYRNVFYEPYGAVHNQQKQPTEDAIVIYDSTSKKWLYDGEVIGNANAQ